MKKALLLFCILSSAVCKLNAQDVTLNQVVNTLKERITLEGYAQVAYTYSDADGEDSNSFDVKRVILMARGKITDKWSCYFMYSFANSSKLLEIYTEYHFMPELSVRVGQFKTMFGIENPLSPTVTELIDCYSQATNYLAGLNGDALYGSHTGRDMGLLVYGDLFGKLVNYKLAIMNGQGINVKDKNNQKDIVGCLTLNPIKELSVVGSFVKGKGCAIATSDINPDIAVGEDYTRNRWSVGAVAKTEPIDIRAEYLGGKDGHVKSEGYYATISAHVLPKFDVIASYDYFNKNKSTSSKQTNYVAGVQYWFYPKCRLQAQYVFSDCHKGDNYNQIQAQIQVRF